MSEPERRQPASGVVQTGTAALANAYDLMSSWYAKETDDAVLTEPGSLVDGSFVFQHAGVRLRATVTEEP
jgi:hypothetical protein